MRPCRGRSPVLLLLLLVIVSGLLPVVVGPPPSRAATAFAGLCRPDPLERPTWCAQDSGLPVGANGQRPALRAVDFTDAYRGHAVGDNATIVATTDGGQNWVQQASGLSPDADGKLPTLYAVSFTDGDADDPCPTAFPRGCFGHAVGTGGTILATTDGGAHWTRQFAAVDSGALPVMSAVSFVDPRHGWIAGEAVVLSTTDGGATWMARPAPQVAEDDEDIDPARDFALLARVHAVDFTDRLHGHLVSFGLATNGSVEPGRPPSLIRTPSRRLRTAASPGFINQLRSWGSCMRLHLLTRTMAGL